MGAGVAAPVSRRAAPVPAAAARASASARPVAPNLVGVPTFLSAVQRRGAAGSSVASRIDQAQQRVQTEDRDQAERLADTIGQPGVGVAMRAQDTREAAREAQAAASDAAEATQRVSALDAAPMSMMSRPESSETDASFFLSTPPSSSSSVDPAGREVPLPGDRSTEFSSAVTGGALGDGGAVADGTATAGPSAEAAAGANTEAGGAASGTGGAYGTAAGRGGARVASGLQSAEPARSTDAAAPDTGAGDLDTGDLGLIDLELAEHQRWAAASGRVGEVASIERAEFIAESVGGGFIEGVATGAAMGLGIGVVTRAVPLIGPIIGGSMALHGLLTRDWAATGETIGRFGEGSDSYETLANSLASVSAVIDVVSGILGVINGIVGVVQAVAIGVAAGAGVLAFFTFGATAGIAIAAGELAVTCEEISEGINLVTMVLDGVNAALLNPCITLFRALHAFTTQADPREVESSGHEIAAAASASGSALGGWIGGRAAHTGARPRPPHDDGAPTTVRPPHEAPPPAAGDGPEVHFQPAPAEGAMHAGAAPEAPASMQQLEMPLAGMSPPPVGRTGGHLEAPIEPLSLRAISSSDVIPQGASEGAIGTYKTTVAEPHPVAIASNPGGPRGGGRGRAPKTGFEDEGLFREHQAPAAAMGEVHPGYEYADAAGRPREGASTREALTIGLSTEVKPYKDAADARLLTDVRQRMARGEDVSGAEVIARGAGHVQDAYAAAGRPAPEQQITRQFLGEMENFHGEDFGYHEFRPGEPSPAGQASPLRGASDAEISQHLDNLFGPHEHPMPPPGGQMSFPGMAPHATAGSSPPSSAAPAEQLALPFASPQLDLFAPRTPADPRARTSPDVPLRIGEASTRTSEPLTPAQYAQSAAMAVEMGMPADQIHPAQGDTSYHPGYDALRIGADVNPLPALQRPADKSAGSGGVSVAAARAARDALAGDAAAPAAGVEHVSPHYTAPPATPAQIVAVQNEILNLLAVRARAEREVAYQDERVAASEANRSPIARTMADTRAGLSAVAAHEAAVARRDAANQEQQRRQQDAAGLTAGYPNRATGLTALSVPLAAWEGFTSLASHLPGDAGDRMVEMNQQARDMQAAFGQMGERMLGVDGDQPARAGALAVDAARLDATGEQAQTSDQRLQSADEGAAGLRDANEATLAQAQARSQAAAERTDSLADAAQERERRASSLSTQLRAWALLHRGQRAGAVAGTARRLETEGNVVTQATPE